MPFYGRARIFISRPWMGNCQWPAGYVCFNFTAGSQSEQNGCCDCQPNTTCFSQLSWQKTFSNVPLGSSVTLNVQQCYQGSWRGVPVYVVQTSPTYYELWGNVIGGTACKFGWLEFVEQSPPTTDCDQFACQNSNLETPGVNIIEKENGYSGYNLCENGGGYGATQPIFNDTDFDFDLEVCFNRQAQKWWFNLNNDNKFLISYISTICENVINANNKKLIWDWQYFPPEYSCDDIMVEIFDNSVYGGSYAKHLLGIILENHENIHVNDFWHLVSQNKSLLDSLITEIDMSCEDFITPQEAEEFFRNILLQIWTTYLRRVAIDWLNFTGRFGSKERELYENNVQYSFLIQSIIRTQARDAGIFHGCEI